MKKSELRNIIREEIQKLNESKFTLNKLEDYYYDNEDDIRDNMRVYGYKKGKDVAKIRNPYDLADVLGIDSRLVRHVDVQVYADMLGGLLDNK